MVLQIRLVIVEKFLARTQKKYQYHKQSQQVEQYAWLNIFS